MYLFNSLISLNLCTERVVAGSIPLINIGRELDM